MAGWKGAVRTGILEREDIAALTRPIMTNLQDLSPAITDHADWPASTKKRAVYAVPRQAIVRVSYSFWRTFDLHTDEEVFRLDLSIFRRGRATGFLRAMGWEF
jgi:hypothetical protein